MNKFIIIKEISLEDLENEVNNFLMNNSNVQIVSHSIEIREYEVSNDEYICTIIYKEGNY